MNGTEFARINGKYSTAFIGTYERTGKNIVDNYSTFTIRVYAYYGGSTHTSSSYGTVWISGTQYGIGGYTLYPGYKLLASKDITVYHNNDGSFPYTTVAFAINSYHANSETSGAISAPTIPRQANVTGYNDFNDEQNPTITYNNPGGFRINARLEFAGTNIKRDNIPNTGSYTFNLTDAERKLLRQKCTNNTMTVRGVIGTCIGGTTENYWSFWDRTMTIVNGNPEFSNFNFEDVNTTTTILTGDPNAVIKGYSTILVTIPTSMKATAKKEATMSKYRITSGTANPVELPYSDTLRVGGQLSAPTDPTINCYAIDSRNNSTLVSKAIATFLNYSVITKGTINANRKNGTSENVTLKIDGTYNAINFGKVTNTIKSAKYRYRVSDSSTWSEYQDLTINTSVSGENGSYSYDGLIMGDTSTKGFNVEKSYTIEVVVSDELSSVTFTANIGSGIPNIALAKNGVGIMGKYNEDVGGLLQVGGKRIDDVFSTEEIKTNKVWIDGKPIYRKVYEISSLPNNGRSYVTCNIPNVQHVITMRGVMESSTEWDNMPSAYTNGTLIDSLVIERSGNTLTRIRILNNFNRSGFSAFVILEYTKTTDNKTNLSSSDNDASTE